MTAGVVLPERANRDPVELAVDCERWGYETVVCGELWGTNALVRLGQLSEATTDLRLGTAIANVFSRSPAVLAMAAQTLAERTGREVLLGIGPSTEQAVRGLHGRSFTDPIERTAETATLLKALLSEGDPVSFDGDTVSVEDIPPLPTRAAVYDAALGPANRRVTGRHCDGWIPHMLPFSELNRAFEAVAEGARAAGRSPETITVAPYVPAAVSEDSTAARRALAGHVAYHVGSGEGYRRAVATAFPERADAIATAWQDGRRDEARELVTEAMLDDLGVAGDPEGAREQFRTITEHPLVERPLLTVPSQAAADVAEPTLRALAPGTA